MRPFPLPFPGARITGAILITGSLLFASAPHAIAQIPDKFENLKVLPKDITRDQLVAVMRGFSTGLGVRCQYCHEAKQGVQAPAPGAVEELDFLAETIEAAGVDSAIAQYRKLRAETMALGRYNFGELTLSDLARQLVTEKKTDAAIRILELNQEHFPASANIDFQIGEIHRGRGEREQAVARYRKALEKAPNHQQAKRRLAELGDK